MAEGKGQRGFVARIKLPFISIAMKSKLKSVFWTTCTFSSKKTISRVIRHGDEATGTNYTIYLEHLGGFLPILKGKKTSKLKPEFVIFDPLKGITVNLYCFIRLLGNSNKPTIFSLLQILKTHFKSRVYMESSRNLSVSKSCKIAQFQRTL